jgi:hypothetical protein
MKELNGNHVISGMVDIIDPENKNSASVDAVVEVSIFCINEVS